MYCQHKLIERNYCSHKCFPTDEFVRTTRSKNNSQRGWLP